MLLHADQQRLQPEQLQLLEAGATRNPYALQNVTAVPDRGIVRARLRTLDGNGSAGRRFGASWLRAGC